MFKLNRPRIHLFAVIFTLGLLAVLGISFTFNPIRAALQSVSLAPGDTLSIECPTRLAGRIEGNSVIVTCILPPNFFPTPTNIPPTEIVPPITPTSSPAPAPVSEVPGRIEAEDYTAWYDTTPGNTGGAYRNDDVDIKACPTCTNGFNVGWIAEGEWLEYPINVRADGAYQIHARVATTYNNRRLRFLLNGVDVTGWMQIPNTDGWQNWTIVTSNAFAMTTGPAVLRMETDIYGFNIDTIAVIPADIAPIPTATPTNEPIPTATPTNEPIPTATPTNEPIPTATPTNEPPPSGGTAYYIDAQNGNDANNGLSANT
ncbi:MAG: carbohydrate-binding protein, partial [Chloroflexales bacterium]|nr:carbohydrate-binding protein [Chloroflexales bacterium]